MPIRVAIFEDNKLVREAFEAILNGTDGFICAGSFSSADNLLFNIQKTRPDVVLMDIEMTGINGIEATGLIIKNYPAIKVLIQTVFEEEEKIFAAICMGASGYILKNTSPADLVEAIKDVETGGAPMSPGIASKVLRMFQRFAPDIKKRAPASNEAELLSSREKEILVLMMDGHSLPMIAEKIFLSYETVRSYVKNIYKKLHVHSHREAVLKAYKDRIV
jgi:DNA-binding NarL/FixJ family response regulator